MGIVEHHVLECRIVELLDALVKSQAQVSDFKSRLRNMTQKQLSVSSLVVNATACLAAIARNVKISDRRPSCPSC